MQTVLKGRCDGDSMCCGHSLHINGGPFNQGQQITLDALSTGVSAAVAALVAGNNRLNKASHHP